MESSGSQVSKALLPCFNFYNNLEALNISDLQFKKDFKYTIAHPFKQEYPPFPIDKIPQIEVILKLCTLYKGKPNGLAHIKYSNPNDKTWSFEGLSVFTDG